MNSKMITPTDIQLTKLPPSFPIQSNPNQISSESQDTRENIADQNESLLFADPIYTIADLLKVHALQYYHRAFITTGYGDFQIVMSLHESQWIPMLDSIKETAQKENDIEMLPAHRQLILSRIKTEKNRRNLLAKQHYNQFDIHNKDREPNRRNPSIRLDYRSKETPFSALKDQTRANRLIICLGCDCFGFPWVVYFLLMVVSLSFGFLFWGLWKTVRDNNPYLLSQEGVWNFLLVSSIICWITSFVFFFCLLVILMSNDKDNVCTHCLGSMQCNDFCLGNDDDYNVDWNQGLLSCFR